jgi:hypothetical protein
MKLDTLAREQAILNRENETEIGEDDEACINAVSLRNTEKGPFQESVSPPRSQHRAR